MTRSRFAPDMAQLPLMLGVAALYFAFGHASFLTAVSHTIVTPVFFAPEGISLAVTILFGPAVWPGIFAGQLALAVSRGLALEPALAISAINSAEAVLGGLLFLRLGAKPSLDRVRDLGVLLALILFVLQPFSATLGTATLALSGVLSDPQEYAASWSSWWIGNSMGQSQVTPMLLIAYTARHRIRAMLGSAWLPLLLLAPAAWLIFGVFADRGISVSLVIFLPLLIWIAETGGLMVVCLASSAITVYALYFTGLGTGPFYLGNQLRIFDLNVFIFGLALTGQFVGALNGERRILRESLEQQARYDFLTGVANRRYFMEQTNQERSRSVRHDKPLSLLMLDIDFFKNINDTHGHKVGDEVIKALTATCALTLRTMDTVGRLGGEEFAVLLPETGLVRAQEVAERLRHALAQVQVPLDKSGAQHVQFTVSIGVTSNESRPAIAVSVEDMLTSADAALYDAKKSGRNRVCVNTEGYFSRAGADSA